MEIVWKTMYVLDGQLEPDEHNRWSIVGYVKIPSDVLPQYKWIAEAVKSDHVLIPIAQIEQKGTSPGNVPSTVDRFCCNVFTSWECGNLGLGKINVFGNTVDEVKEKVQEHLNKFQEVIKSAL